MCCSAYPINHQLAEVIANMGFVVCTLEETYVREVEEILGPAPAWFASRKTKG